MAKPNLYSEHFQGYFQSYKLMASNLFDYLQLVDFINADRSYFYSTSPDKQTLTIYVSVYNRRVSSLTALLPAGIIMERDWHEISTLHI